MTIKGVRWRIRRRPWLGTDKDAGLCDPDSKSIIIHETGNTIYDADTELHEAAHAISFAYGLDLPERAVKALARELVANGWRREVTQKQPRKRGGR